MVASERRIPDYVIDLNRDVADLTANQRQMQKELDDLHEGMNGLVDLWPNTSLLSKNFVTRAFAVWGHGLLVTGLFYVVLIVIGIALATIN